MSAYLVVQSCSDTERKQEVMSDDPHAVIEYEEQANHHR